MIVNNINGKLDTFSGLKTITFEIAALLLVPRKDNYSMPMSEIVIFRKILLSFK